MEKTKRGFKISRDIFAIVGITFLVIYVVSLFIPLIWAVITSLKTREDFYYNKFGLPEQWMFVNYVTAFTKMSITVNVPGGTATAYTYQMFMNGLIYALGCTFMGIMTPAVTAYCVAKYKFFFGRILYGIVIFTNALMAIPYALKVLENPMRDVTTRYSMLCQSLGIKGWSRLKVVELRALKRPLAQAMAFACVLSIGDFGVVALFGNEDFRTLPFYLYQQIGSYRSQDGAVTALLLLILCFTLFTIIEKLPGRNVKTD